MTDMLCDFEKECSISSWIDPCVSDVDKVYRIDHPTGALVMRAGIPESQWHTVKTEMLIELRDNVESFRKEQNKALNRLIDRLGADDE